MHLNFNNLYIDYCSNRFVFTWVKKLRSPSKLKCNSHVKSYYLLPWLLFSSSGEKTSVHSKDKFRTDFANNMVHQEFSFFYTQKRCSLLTLLWTLPFLLSSRLVRGGHLTQEKLIHEQDCISQIVSSKIQKVTQIL